MMIFHRKMMISHDFTIILGVREKKSRTPPGTKNIRVPLREILASPRRPQKPNPPTRGARNFVFRVLGAKCTKLKKFRVPATRV